MLLRRLHSLPLLCVLVFCLLASPVSAIGYVWCFSGDGHAALESALAGECGQDAQASPAGNFSALILDSEADDCGPCLDIAFTPQWGSSRGRDSETPVSPPSLFAPATFVSFISQIPPFHPNGLMLEPAPRIFEPILHHRTTVLLI